MTAKIWVFPAATYLIIVAAVVWDVMRGGDE